MARASDRFALVTMDDDVLALWCSRKSTPISPPGAGFYRLDYLEVEPSRRAARVGAFALALAAKRAKEAGASGLLLAAIPNVASFYQELGFSRRAAPGWNTEVGLVAYELKGGGYDALAEKADAFLEETAASEGVP